MTTTLETLTARDIMTTDVVTVTPDMTLREAIGILDEHHISGAPVLSGRNVVGILSAADVLAFASTTSPVPEARPEAETDWEEAEPVSAYFTDLWDDAGADTVERVRAARGPEWDFLGEHTVSEAMTLGVRRVQADATLGETAAYMLHYSVHRVLVMDGQDLLGLVSTTDFLRAIASS